MHAKCPTPSFGAPTLSRWASRYIAPRTTASSGARERASVGAGVGSGRPGQRRRERRVRRAAELLEAPVARERPLRRAVARHRRAAARECGIVEELRADVPRGGRGAVGAVGERGIAATVADRARAPREALGRAEAREVPGVGVVARRKGASARATTPTAAVGVRRRRRRPGRAAAR